MEGNEGCGGEGADAPGAEADPAQRPERRYAFVAKVGQRGVLLVGPLTQQRQRLGVGAQRGGVVLTPGRTPQVHNGQPSGAALT